MSIFDDVPISKNSGTQRTIDRIRGKKPVREAVHIPMVSMKDLQKQAYADMKAQRDYKASQQTGAETYIDKGTKRPFPPETVKRSVLEFRQDLLELFFYDKFRTIKDVAEHVGMTPAGVGAHVRLLVQLEYLFKPATAAEQKKGFLRLYKDWDDSEWYVKEIIENV